MGGRRVHVQKPGYAGRGSASSTLDVVSGRAAPRSLRELNTVEQLKALAAAASVPVRRVPEGARTVSREQAYLVLHADDTYRYSARHFVGEIEARLGVKNPTPVVPRAETDRSPEEVKAEQDVARRKYWARKRRGPGI